MRLAALKLGLIASLTVSMAGCGGWSPFQRQAEDEASDEDSGDDSTTSDPKAGETPGIPGIRLQDLPEGNAPLTNVDEIIERLNLAGYYERGFYGQGLKIAVLDNGFTGVSHSIGTRLPPDTVLVEAPRPDMQNTTHGTKMAEIAYAVATGHATFRTDVSGPEIRLYNTNGYTNFAAAVDQVIEDGVDVVLYSQVWEYGGNLDGGGFINRLVNKATKAGILWINASGNYGQASYGGPVAISTDGTVKLPHEDKYVRFTVPQNGTPIKVVLAWNDFDGSKDYMTPQDLDLYVEDASGKEVGKATLIQDGKTDPMLAENAGKHSSHAREIVSTTLGTGSYRLRVVAKSRNFDFSSRLRLTVDGHGVRMVDAEKTHTVMIPADNAAVLTIGASDVETSGRVIDEDGKLAKPELGVVSEVKFANGERHRGTSAAAAIAAGAMAVFRTAYGELSREELQSLINIGSLGKPDASCTDATKCLSAPVLTLPAW
jgi:hypothetical protein